AASVHGNRSCVDDMTFDAVRLQESVYPETVETGFVDRNNPHRGAAGSLRSGHQPLQQGKKSSRISCTHLVPADPVAARHAGTDQPGRTTEFQRHKQRSIVRIGGGPRMGSAVVGASHPIISSN